MGREHIPAIPGDWSLLREKREGLSEEAVELGADTP